MGDRLPLRQGGLGLAVAPATMGVGNPTGPLQAPPPVGAHGILPPIVVLPPAAGGAAQKYPRVLLYAARRTSSEVAGTVAGPGGRLPQPGALKNL